MRRLVLVPAPADAKPVATITPARVGTTNKRPPIPGRQLTAAEMLEIDGVVCRGLGKLPRESIAQCAERLLADPNTDPWLASVARLFRHTCAGWPVMKRAAKAFGWKRGAA